MRISTFNRGMTDEVATPAPEVNTVVGRKGHRNGSERATGQCNRADRRVPVWTAIRPGADTCLALLC